MQILNYSVNLKDVNILRKAKGKTQTSYVPFTYQQQPADEYLTYWSAGRGYKAAWMHPQKCSQWISFLFLHVRYHDTKARHSLGKGCEAPLPNLYWLEPFPSQTNGKLRFRLLEHSSPTAEGWDRVPGFSYSTHAELETLHVVIY